MKQEGANGSVPQELSGRPVTPAVDSFEVIEGQYPRARVKGWLILWVCELFSLYFIWGTVENVTTPNLGQDRWMLVISGFAGSIGLSAIGYVLWREHLTWAQGMGLRYAADTEQVTFVGCVQPAATYGDLPRGTKSSSCHISEVERITEKRPRDKDPYVKIWFRDQCAVLDRSLFLHSKVQTLFEGVPYEKAPAPEERPSDGAYV